MPVKTLKHEWLTLLVGSVTHAWPTLTKHRLLSVADNARLCGTLISVVEMTFHAVYAEYYNIYLLFPFCQFDILEMGHKTEKQLLYCRPFDLPCIEYSHFLWPWVTFKVMPPITSLLNCDFLYDLFKEIEDSRLRPMPHSDELNQTLFVWRLAGVATWQTLFKFDVVLDSGPLTRAMKTQRHPQNRKYITYRNAVRGKPSHGHRRHAFIANGLRVMTANRQTAKLIYWSQYFEPLMRANPRQNITVTETVAFHWLGAGFSTAD